MDLVVSAGIKQHKLLLLCIVFSLAFASTASAQSSGQILTTLPENNRIRSQLDQFAKFLAELSENGSSPAVNVEQIEGNGGTILDRLEENSEEMGLVPMFSLRRHGLVFGHDSVPFLATDYEMARVLDNVARPILNQTLTAAESNLRILFTIPGQPRGIVSATSKEYQNVADFSGQKIASANPALNSQLAELGFSPTNLPPNEFYLALRNGAVDTAITPIFPQIVDLVKNNMLYYDAQVYIPKTAMVVNTNWEMSLSDADRSRLVLAAKLAEEEAWKDAELFNRAQLSQSNMPSNNIRFFSTELKAQIEEIRPKLIEVAAIDDNVFQQVIQAYEDVRDPAVACTTVLIPFITNRKPARPIWGKLSYLNINGRKLYFGSDLDSKIHYGAVKVSIPIRKGDPDPFREECVKRDQIEGDLSKHRYIISAEILSPEEFDSVIDEAIRQQVARRKMQDSSSSDHLGGFAYIHGFANDFESSSEMIAELAKRFQFRSVPIMVAWSSVGGLLPADYKADSKIVENIVPGFKDLLKRLFTNTSLSSMHVIAHSMGNRVMLPTLSELAQDQSWSNRLLAMISLAPDVEFERYGKLAAKANGTANMKSIYVSENDKALMLSQAVNGDRRAGLKVDENVMIVPDADTVNVGTLEAGMMAHSYQLNQLIQRDIAETVYSLNKPTNRYLDSASTSSGDAYWEFP